MSSTIEQTLAAAGTVTREVADAIHAIHVAFDTYSEQGDPNAIDDIVTAGATLQPLLPGYEVTAGAEMPWDRNDDEYYVDRDLPGWTEAGVDVAYRICLLRSRTKTISALTSAFENLSNAVSSLDTYHPGYDYNHGTITA